MNIDKAVQDLLEDVTKEVVKDESLSDDELDRAIENPENLVTAMMSIVQSMEKALVELTKK